MKILDVQGYSLSSGFGNKSYLGYLNNNKLKNIGVIEVVTNKKIIGYGETYSGVYAGELIKPIIDFLKTNIVNKKLENIEDIKKINSKILSKPFISRNGIIPSVYSAINIALYDALSQHKEIPLYKLLSKKSAKKVRVYASNGSSTFSPREIKEDVYKILDLGFNSFKMRIGHQEWGQDLKRVETARAILEDKNLMLDAIMGTIYPPWDYAKADKKLRQINKFNPLWIEEPLIPNDYYGYQRLNKKYPIAGGEALNNLSDYGIYKEFNCVDYIQPDVTNVGGYDVLKMIAQLFKKKKIAIHVWGSKIAFLANLHYCLSSSVNFLEYPMMNLDIDKEIIKESLKIEGNYIHPPDEPGLGVHISSSVKRKYKIKKMSNYLL